MPLSLYALDEFVAQELSQLKECRVSEIASKFPNYNTWLNAFVLNWIFRVPISKDKAALAFVLIRRAEAAIEDYEEARNLLMRFVANRENISLYFRCLRRFESTIAMTSQFFYFARKALDVRLFDERDGSPYERLNWIYNESRHFKAEELPAGQLHAVWIRNEGLFAEGTSLTFDELYELLYEIGSIASKIANGEVLA